MLEESQPFLTTLLSTEEIEKIPPDIAKKIDDHYGQRFEELLTHKALSEGARTNIGMSNFIKSLV